jgi:hypothetical protein
VAIGGYDRRRGSTESCTLVNNTVVRSAGPALLVQFDTRDNLIANNVIVAGDNHVFVENPYRENAGNTVDHNMYWVSDGSTRGTWEWKGREYGSFARWRAESGIDQDSVFDDPEFVDPAADNYALRESSPGVDAGLRLAVAGTKDLLGEARSQGTAIDVGAVEFNSPEPSPTPEISGTAVALGDVKWISQSNGWGPVEVDMSNGERPQGDGLPLRIGAMEFARGIGTHAPSRILFDVPEDCTVFLSDVGLDEEVGDQGTVVFEVYGDGDLLTTSGLVFATDEPIPLVADVTGVNQLELVVTRGGDGNAFDHADWGDARLDCAAG